MILLTPGPTPVPDRVLRATARQPIPHRAPEFETILAECQPRLRSLFATRGPVLTLAGSGTLAMESALWSLAPTEGSVVTCHSGKFGERWAESSRRAARVLGASVHAVSAPWGEPIAPALLADALRAAPDTRLVALVHCETSTATVSEARALAEVVHDLAPDALIVMDGITSVGAIPVEMDTWGLDAVACASQKALGLPPGLGFVALSERAAVLLSGTGVSHVNSVPLSLDLAAARRAHRAGRTPFTPAINLIFGLAESLTMIEEEGRAARIVRCATLARATRDAACAMGLSIHSSAPSDSVSAVAVPDGLADRVRSFCTTERGVLLAGGQDSWAGIVVRMSHMGFVGVRETRTGIQAIAAALDALAPGRFDTQAGLAAMENGLGAERAEGAPR